MAPIGVFDSGYGGLTVLKKITEKLPEYDIIYLGDNARSPYGNRSFDLIYKYTIQAVQTLFDRGCRLVLLACNTASAKALRNIQQKDLPIIDPERRVLGVIRPTVEILGSITKTGNIGILGTVGTIQSNSYVIEINKLFKDIKVTQEACPIWVPLVENDEIDNPGCEYFVEKNISNLLKKNNLIDTIILGCTHYPLLSNVIKKHTPSGINIISQDEIVAVSLCDYLKRHDDIDSSCGKNGIIQFLTTDSAELFNERGAKFFGKEIISERIQY